MGNQYDLEQAQDRLNRIYIGNLESDLLAGEGLGGGGVGHQSPFVPVKVK